MYSYQDIERIKASLEWIVNQATTCEHLPTRQDQGVIDSLLELIQSYDLLQVLILEHGASVIDYDITRGLAATEMFIAKAKRNTGTMLRRICVLCPGAANRLRRYRAHSPLWRWVSHKNLNGTKHAVRRTSKTIRYLRCAGNNGLALLEAKFICKGELGSPGYVIC